MPRRTPPNRLADIAEAARKVFTEKGYRRTLMTDVGKELGLSHALLYRFVHPPPDAGTR
jgi:AcrR family transcriptional regulator